MKKQDLAKAIKSVLAENTKSKLNESAIRQAVREVLAEQPEDPSGRTQLPAVKYLAQQHGEVYNKIAAANSRDNKIADANSRVPKLGVTNYDIADIMDNYVEYLKTFGPDGKAINEETHDTIKDIIRNHGNKPSEAEVRANLTGIDDDEVLNYFGYDSGSVLRYQYGRPVYADQKNKTTNWKYSGGGYGRKRYE